MSNRDGRAVLVLGFVTFALVFTVAAPAVAQRDYEPVLDKFNFKAEFSWVNLSTEIRLDSSLAERGATLTFEDDLGLGDLFGVTCTGPVEGPMQNSYLRLEREVIEFETLPLPPEAADPAETSDGANLVLRIEKGDDVHEIRATTSVSARE